MCHHDFMIITDVKESSVYPFSAYYSLSCYSSIRYCLSIIFILPLIIHLLSVLLLRILLKNFSFFTLLLYFSIIFFNLLATDFFFKF